MIIIIHVFFSRWWNSGKFKYYYYKYYIGWLAQCIGNFAIAVCTWHSNGIYSLNTCNSTTRLNFDYYVSKYHEKIFYFDKNYVIKIFLK